MFVFRLEKKIIKKGMKKTCKTWERCLGNACPPLLQQCREMTSNEAHWWLVPNEQKELLPPTLPSEVLERSALGYCGY